MESQHELFPLRNVIKDRVDHESHFDVQGLLMCDRMLAHMSLFGVLWAFGSGVICAEDVNHAHYS
jgi:hypothetical protein